MLLTIGINHLIAKNRKLKGENIVNELFENTRKPQGFGGKLMAKMMNSGHAKVSQWDSQISPRSQTLRCWMSAAEAAQILRPGWTSAETVSVTGLDYSEVSVAESQELNAAAIKQGKCRCFRAMYRRFPFLMRSLIMSPPLRQFISGRV